jgi:aspartate aminotransferase/aminotransferase
MSGWRIGYALSNAAFINQLLKLNQHLVTCAPTVLQYYLAHYFDDILNLTLPQAQAALAKRRRVAVEMQRAGLDCLAGDSTFYFFVSIGDFPGTSFDLAVHLLLEKGIAVVPGSAYGKGTDRFIRVSIGTESEERIAAALREIKAAINQPVDRQRLIRRLQDSGLREMSEMVSVA